MAVTWTAGRSDGHTVPGRDCSTTTTVRPCATTTVTAPPRSVARKSGSGTVASGSTNTVRTGCVSRCAASMRSPINGGTLTATGPAS